LCFVLCAAAVQAQSPLPQLVEEVLRRNPEILAAQKRVEAARQRPDRESALPDPMISAGYSSAGKPWPLAGLGREPTANVGVMISQEIPAPGKTRLRGAVVQREAEAEFEEYQRVKLSVVSRLKQAWRRLHNAYAMAELAERNRDLLRKFLRVAEARYAVGRGMQQDLFRAQTQLAVLDTRLERLGQERRSREAEINSLLFRPLDTPVPRPPDPGVPDFRMPLEELDAAARRNSPMLRREEKMIERAELAVNLARKDYYPDYTVSGGYFNMGRMPDMYEFRVGLTLPLWFARKQRAGVAEQAHLLSQTRRGYESSEANLLFRVKDDYLMAQTSLRLLKMYSETVVPQATLTLESSLAAYGTGGVDFLTLLSNLMNVVEYEGNYQEELLNFHLALIRLEEVTGLTLVEE
jgi:outer membrane protein TolC